MCGRRRSGGGNPRRQRAGDRRHIKGGGGGGRPAAGRPRDLLPLIRALDPSEGAILHPRGEDAAFTFGALGDEGFTLREAILYRAVKAETLPPEAISAAPRAALIYSARTAEAFAAALALDPRLDPLTIIGISPAALAPLAPRSTIPAPEPTEAAMLAALAKAVPPGKN